MTDLPILGKNNYCPVCLHVKCVCKVLPLVGETSESKYSLGDVMAMLPENLTRIVWDAFLIAERQGEQWHDQDTCKLIVKKILNNEPIEYAKGNLP